MDKEEEAARLIGCVPWEAAEEYYCRARPCENFSMGFGALGMVLS